MKKNILVLALLMFFISACGSFLSKPQTDREMAEQTVRDFYKALDKGRYAEAYQLLNEEQRANSSEEEYGSNLEDFLKSVKITSIEPYEGAVETERCKRFYVVLDQKLKKGPVESRQLVSEKWLTVVKEGEDWKLYPDLFGPDKEACNDLE